MAAEKPHIRYVRELETAGPAWIKDNAGLLVWGMGRLAALNHDERIDGLTHALMLMHRYYDPAKSRHTTYFTWACRAGRESIRRQRHRASRFVPLDVAPPFHVTDDPAREVDAADSVAAALARCTPRQRQCVDLVYGLTSRRPMDMESVGKIVGMTRQGVSESVRCALRRMRTCAQS